ncbi:MAG: GNAT family N-acetyltransferase [Actinomycetota bacterium]|nr:GNAT family N-acetyltransferase [Actinomycetota bacterium]
MSISEQAVPAPAAARARAECRIASTSEEVEIHYRIRHQVFVVEQRLFEGSDVDSYDAAAGVVHVLGLWDGEPVGVVRLFPLDPSTDLWQGDRLAVLPGYRVRNLGKPLVRFAVATAAARGGREMVAHIQLPNVAFFERIGWRPYGDVESYVGVAHQPMSIDLTRYR